MKELNAFETHKFKPVLQYYSIKQAALAHSLGISQASLSNQLSGIVPMKEHIELAIEELIRHLRNKTKKPKYTKIIKRGDEMAKMKKPIIPKSSVKVPDKKKSKAKIKNLRLPKIES
jgi:DNA transposition AAA+ family ATPase